MCSRFKRLVPTSEAIINFFFFVTLQVSSSTQKNINKLRRNVKDNQDVEECVIFTLETKKQHAKCINTVRIR